MTDDVTRPEVEYTKSGVPKNCTGCGHPFHPAGACSHPWDEYARCLCEANMAVRLDIQPAPSTVKNHVPTEFCSLDHPDYICDWKDCPGRGTSHSTHAASDVA